MRRREILLTGGLLASGGALIVNDYRESSGESTDSESEDSGDSRQNNDVEEPDPDSENNSGDNSEDDSENESGGEENETETESENESDEGENESTAEQNRPNDATETITVTSHDLELEEYPEQDYTEVYVIGTAETGDYTLADVQIGAAGLDQSGQPIAENSVPYSAVDAHTEIQFEVPLNVDPDLLESYEVAVVDAEYAN